MFRCFHHVMRLVSIIKYTRYRASTTNLEPIPPRPRDYIGSGDESADNTDVQQRPNAKISRLSPLVGQETVKHHKHEKTLVQISIA